MTSISRLEHASVFQLEVTTNQDTRLDYIKTFQFQHQITPDLDTRLYCTKGCSFNYQISSDEETRLDFIKDYGSNIRSL